MKFILDRFQKILKKNLKKNLKNINLFLIFLESSETYQKKIHQNRSKTNIFVEKSLKSQKLKMKILLKQKKEKINLKIVLHKFVLYTYAYKNSIEILDFNSNYKCQCLSLHENWLFPMVRA